MGRPGLQRVQSGWKVTSRAIIAPLGPPGLLGGPPAMWPYLRCRLGRTFGHFAPRFRL